MLRKHAFSPLFSSLLIALLAALCPLVPAHAAGPSLPLWQYTLGRGLSISNTGLNLGGYASTKYENLRDKPGRYSLTVSPFISWDLLGRVRFFTELEMEDIAIVEAGRGLRSRGDPLEIQRLYADFFVSDALALRAGKFFTPIGRWNEIQADPLVWTTSRPFVTSRPFAEDTTGLMLHGRLTPFDRELEYALFGALPEDLDPDETEGASEFTKAIGFRLRYHLGSVELGASYANFIREEEFLIERVCEEDELEEEDCEEGLIEEEFEVKQRENLLGLDVFWSENKYELYGEFAYRLGGKGRANPEWGLFLQGVAPLPLPLTRDLFAIGRYEFFDPTGPVPGVHIWTLGTAFRPLPPIILKAEYSVAHRNFAEVPEGFAMSIAILF